MAQACCSGAQGERDLPPPAGAHDVEGRPEPSSNCSQPARPCWCRLPVLRVCVCTCVCVSNELGWPGTRLLIEERQAQEHRGSLVFTISGSGFSFKSCVSSTPKHPTGVFP